MQTLFLITISASVINLALILHALAARKWRVVGRALLFMAVGGLLGIVILQQSASEPFLEALSGIRLRSDVLYIYLMAVVLGLISFVWSSVVDRKSSR